MNHHHRQVWATVFVIIPLIVILVAVIFGGALVTLTAPPRSAPVSAEGCVRGQAVQEDWSWGVGIEYVIGAPPSPWD